MAQDKKEDLDRVLHDLGVRLNKVPGDMRWLLNKFEESGVNTGVELADLAGDYRAAYLEHKMGAKVDLESFEKKLKESAGDYRGNELIRASQNDVERFLKNNFGQTK